MDDIFYMKKAVDLSKKAFNRDEVPVGCVVVCNNKIIATSYNHKEKKQIATEHAEIIAIRKACKKKKSWRLDDCILYTTFEPCIMCAGAIIESRIKKVVYGVNKIDKGSASFLKNNNVVVKSGVLENESLALLRTFFENKR